MPSPLTALDTPALRGALHGTMERHGRAPEHLCILGNRVTRGATKAEAFAAMARLIQRRQGAR